MKEIINLLKEKIEFQKALIERIEKDYTDAIDKLKTAAKNGRVSDYRIGLIEVRREERDKQRDVLNNLRHALTSVRQANGESIFHFSTFTPELD